MGTPQTGTKLHTNKMLIMDDMAYEIFCYTVRIQ